VSREIEPKVRRLRLVEDLAAQGYLRDPRVREAFLRVPREEFVRPADRAAAYSDAPLPIGEGQTISAPSMIAIMLGEANLAPGERVLEVGTGSGYQAALMGCLVGPENVTSLERIPALAALGEANLRRCGFEATRVVQGDGSLGYPPLAPYDCIMGTAGAPQLPRAWPGQLTRVGRIVVPIGRSRYSQELVVATVRPDGRVDIRRSVACAFVPLIGADGWPSDAS
jgi:protein-L-isoaspartate(D-aspartate) O-methyltransferase